MKNLTLYVNVWQSSGVLHVEINGIYLSLRKGIAVGYGGIWLNTKL